MSAIDDAVAWMQADKSRGYKRAAKQFGVPVAELRERMGRSRTRARTREAPARARTGSTSAALPTEPGNDDPVAFYRAWVERTSAMIEAASGRERAALLGQLDKYQTKYQEALAKSDRADDIVDPVLMIDEVLRELEKCRAVFTAEQSERLTALAAEVARMHES